MNKRDGFTLLEIILTLAILVILSSDVFIWFGSYRQTAEVDSAAKMSIDALRDAQSRSANGRDSKRWGVYFDAAGSSFILFAERVEGEGFSTSETREENSFSSSVKIGAISINGGGNEIIFNKPRGDTTQYGTIRIEDKNNGGIARNININPAGLISGQ